MVSGAEGPLLAAAALLAASSVAKLRRPRPAAQAMRVLGLPHGALAARGLAAVELVVAVAAVAAGSAPAAAALAALYLGFAVAAVRMLRLGPAATSCGCTGRDDTPVTRAHVLVSVAAMAAGLAAVVAPPGPPGGPAAAQLTVGVLALLGGALGWLAITSLAALQQALAGGA